MFKYKYILLSIVLALGFTSCKRVKKYDVSLLYPNWADGIAITYLAKNIIEDKGYKVSMKRLEPGPIFASIARGDEDIYMDAWLPYTHKNYWDRFGDRVDLLGSVFDDGSTGLVVPEYVTIQDIEELNKYKDKFNGKIYGISSGAGIFANTNKAIKEYRLEYSQLPSSETSMVAALKKAINEKEWIVITGWKPHFMWSQFHLKLLKDSKNFFPTDKISIISRKDFDKDEPELTEFFKNFKLNEDLLNELMSTVSENNDPNIGAKKFYQKYKSSLSHWLKPNPKNAK